MATVDLESPFVSQELSHTGPIRRRTVTSNAVINWTFTLNNYRDEDFDHLDNLYRQGHFKYLIYGKEVCPSTDTPHLQGFVQLSKKQRFNGVKKMLGDKYHIEQAIHPWFAAEYCKKDGEFNEFGKFVTQVTLLYE